MTHPLLGVLQEECAEVIQAVSKVRRSGPDFRPFDGPATNADNLRREVLDVLAVLRLAHTLGVIPAISEAELDLATETKRASLVRWTPAALEFPS